MSVHIPSKVPIISPALAAMDVVKIQEINWIIFNHVHIFNSSELSVRYVTKKCYLINSKNTLQDFIANLHKTEKKLICSMCNGSYSTAAILKRHKRNVHGINI